MKRNVYPLPKLFDGCCMDGDPMTKGFSMLTKGFKYIPHYHCPICGAIANLIICEFGCLGCLLCYNGYAGSYIKIAEVDQEKVMKRI